MKLSHGLIWTLFQVCWALEGPDTVIAPLGGSIALQCKYGRGDEEAVKYWCKEASRRFCSSNHIIQTTGSEAEVKWKRMSIKDNHRFCEFRVSMVNLTYGDAGTYLCGVERRYDIWHKVEVIITPDFSVSTHFRSMEQTTEGPGGATIIPERIQPSNIDFPFLVLLKVPIFLAMVAAIVWVHTWYRTGRSSNTKTPKTREEHQVATSKGVYQDKKTVL